jgi:osmotically inducible lipoprotein OsmB
MCGISDCM